MRKLAAFVAATLAICGHAHAAVRGGYVASSSIPSCDITKNIVADFGAVGNGTSNDTPAFVGTGSFQDWAVNTYQPANPGKTICLTIPAGKYLFGTFSGIPIFNGITNLVVNAAGATLYNALNITTSASTAAGNAVLTFSSVPAIVSASLIGQPILDVTNSNAIGGSITVQSATSNTITLSGNVSSPGVSNGDTISISAGGEFLGTAGLIDDNQHNALLQTLSAGSSTINLVSTSDASKFTANTWALLTGIDMEGFGFPPNPYVWEYVFITNVNGSTGAITLQSPTKFAYESTWPHYNFGDAFHIDQGGPAMLYALPATWNVAHIYNNLGVYQYANSTLINVNGRSITFNNPVFTNWGPNFSQQQTLTLNNPDLSTVARIETDKLWDTVNINGGTVTGFFIQSASVSGTINLNGVHVTSGGTSGTGGYLNISNNSTLDLGVQMGPATNGETQSISCTNSALNGGVAINTRLDDATSKPGVSMSGGLLTIPRTLEAPIPWAGPGIGMYWGGNSTFEIPFSVTDLTADATNNYIQTSLSGGLPGLPGALNVRTATSKTINFSGCTGTPAVVDMSQAGARNAAPFTYSNRIYTCTNNVATVQAANPGIPVIDLNNPPSGDPIMARALSSMIINVSRADTGASPTVNFHAMAQFDNYPTYAASGSLTGWGAIINLKTAGSRAYNGSTSTWSGSQTGDTLPTIPNPSYMSGAMQPFTSTDVTGESGATCPIVSVTVQTN